MQEYTRKINRGFQLTLPQSFRDSYNINVGDYVRMHEENGRLIIEPVKIISKNPAEALESLFKTASDNFDNLSEEEIMNLVRKEIKKSRKSGKKTSEGKE